LGKNLRVKQFKFAISEEGGGEHTMMEFSKSLKAGIYTFINLTRKKTYREISTDVERFLMGILEQRVQAK